MKLIINRANYYYNIVSSFADELPYCYKYSYKGSQDDRYCFFFWIYYTIANCVLHYDARKSAKQVAFRNVRNYL